MNCLLIAIYLLICQLSTYQSDAAAIPKKVVEIYVAIDQKVVKDYIHFGSTEAGAKDDAKKEAEYFLAEVDKIIQSTGTNIAIRVSRMDVLAKDVFNDCLLRDGDGIHKDIGLQTFQDYLKKQGLFQSLKYDMALLWTGYNLYGQNDMTAGYATVGAVCNEAAASLVEYDGTYKTVHIAAHEIGHVLGLNHDRGACNNGHIMTDTLSYSAQRWSFSSCSIQTLTELIPQMTCLTDTNPQSEVPDEPVRDLLLDVNVMCKRGRNQTNSYMCQGPNLYGGGRPQGDIVCERIFCSVPGTSSCSLAYTTNGFICGVGKRCSDGKCVTAPSDFPTPPGLKANCLYDDAGGLTFDGERTTCTDLFKPAKNKRHCYSPSVEQNCCGTCESLKGDNPECLYGDHSEACVTYPQNSICPNYKETLCCEYCKDWEAKRGADNDEDPPVLPEPKVERVTPEEVEQEDQGDGPNNSE